MKVKVLPPVKKFPCNMTKEELDTKVLADVRKKFAPKRPPPKQVFTAS
jgi:hypothetical protein